MTTALATRQVPAQRLPFAGLPSALPASLKPSLPADRAGLPASGLDRIGATATYAAGRTIFEAGDPARNVFRVAHGVVRAVRLLADGRRCITNFFAAGDFIALADNEAYSHTLEAVTDTRLTRYPRRTLNATLEADPSIGRRLLALMCTELSATHDRLLLLGRKSAVERIASFLLTMADRRAANGNDSDVIELPMSRSDIADYLGLTIETVSRTLAVLQRRRIIALPKTQRVVLLDRDALDDIGAGDA
ncbi:MAG: cyclic nucleotide-binding domain-containing protein [Alphaproteobacteria bacterium]|nr:cyclic nucleotide-binding domain-containing protein [Alphaproteobacteria bacterium]